MLFGRVAVLVLSVFSSPPLRRWRRTLLNRLGNSSLVPPCAHHCPGMAVAPTRRAQKQVRETAATTPRVRHTRRSLSSHPGSSTDVWTSTLLRTSQPDSLMYFFVYVYVCCVKMTQHSAQYIRTLTFREAPVLKAYLYNGLQLVVPTFQREGGSQ